MEQGLLKIDIFPCAEDGSELQDEDFVDDPKELVCIVRVSYAYTKIRVWQAVCSKLCCILVMFCSYDPNDASFRYICFKQGWEKCWFPRNMGPFPMNMDPFPNFVCICLFEKQDFPPNVSFPR